jgi:hypothetical protein
VNHGGARRDERLEDAWIKHTPSGEVIRTADWIIDLGPEGGEKGGEVFAEGTPEDVAQELRSYTGAYLKELLAKSIRAESPAGSARKSVRPLPQRASGSPLGDASCKRVEE